MATEISDNLQDLQNQFNSLSQQVGDLAGQASKNFPQDKAVPLSNIPQGPGSRLDADTLDGYQLTPASQPGKNSVVATDNNGKFPVSTMPGITQVVVTGGHTLTFTNGVLTAYV